jgi:hypothetical protein
MTLRSTVSWWVGGAVRRAYSETEHRWTTLYTTVLAVMHVATEAVRLLGQRAKPAWGQWRGCAARRVDGRRSSVTSKSVADVAPWRLADARCAGSLPAAPGVLGKLAAIRFRDVGHRLGYAGRARLFRCVKP